jgi:glycosyltransferase involved in cell wall biosynthesis
MQTHYPKAKHAPTGINLSAIPFSDKPNEHYAFMSTHARHKGWPMVKEFAAINDIGLEVTSDLTGQEKWDWLGFATALLHPSSIDAAPRLPLEAAACGTPTICLNLDGAVEHVEDGLTGFVCEDWKGIESALTSVKMLDRSLIRKWVERTHSYEPMIDRYEELLQHVATGERW